MKWYGKEAYERIKKEHEANLKRAAIDLSNYIKTQLSQKCPPHSAPHHVPHLETGELRRSLTWDFAKDEFGNLVARVGSNKKYAGPLEKGSETMEDREFLKKSAEERADRTKQILKGK